MPSDVTSCLSPWTLFKTQSSDTGGRHYLGKKHAFGSESSPSAHIDLVFDTGRVKFMPNAGTAPVLKVRAQTMEDSDNLQQQLLGGAHLNPFLVQVEILLEKPADGSSGIPDLLGRAVRRPRPCRERRGCRNPSRECHSSPPGWCAGPERKQTPQDTL